MPLTPGEADRLLLFTQAELARSRQARGLLLNAPEATALIADAVCEWARDGLDLPTVRERARNLLGRHDVLPHVSDVVTEVRVEARFDDGTRLVVVPDPFGTLALHPIPSPHLPAGPAIRIVNESPTAIGISSHIHLAEVNPRLRLDRAAAFGMHLDVRAGSTTWIEAGDSVLLAMRPIGGERVVIGNTGLIDGPLDDLSVRARALMMLRDCGYLDLVDGLPLNTAADADGAVARVMEQRP